MALPPAARATTQKVVARAAVAIAHFDRDCPEGLVLSPLPLGYGAWVMSPVHYVVRHGRRHFLHTSVFGMQAESRLCRQEQRQAPKDLKDLMRRSFRWRLYVKWKLRGKTYRPFMVEE